MTVQFVEVLSLLGKLLFQFSQAVGPRVDMCKPIVPDVFQLDLLTKTLAYLSISFSLMNLVSLACSRLVQLSLFHVAGTSQQTPELLRCPHGWWTITQHDSMRKKRTLMPLHQI
jgi:hypothetical protein